VVTLFHRQAGPNAVFHSLEKWACVTGDIPRTREKWSSQYKTAVKFFIGNVA